MKEIVDKLHQLGFKKNDAKVYFTLLQLGASNPSEISKKTNIVRARVYDSLKRLEKKGFVEREAVSRAPEYSAVNPDLVFSNIKGELTNKLNISEQLLESIKEKVKIKPEKGTWAIKGIPKIKSKIENIISNTNKRLLALITPDYTKTSEKWIYDLLLLKAKSKIEINIGMKIKKDNLPDVKKLIAKKIKVYNWHFTEEIPIGLYTSDSENTLLTVIGSWKKIYEHNIGFLIQGSPAQHKGFEFLIDWFFASCQNGEERVNELEGE